MKLVVIVAALVYAPAALAAEDFGIMVDVYNKYEWREETLRVCHVKKGTLILQERRAITIVDASTCRPNERPAVTLTVGKCGELKNGTNSLNGECRLPF